MAGYGEQRAGGGRRGAEQVALAIAAGATHAEAAAQAGVGARSVSRMATDPAFRARVDELRGQLLAQALGKLGGGAARAVETLVKLLDSAHDGVRLGTARAILENLLRVREQVELADRVRDLEEALRERPAARTHGGGP